MSKSLHDEIMAMGYDQYQALCGDYCGGFSHAQRAAAELAQKHSQPINIVFDESGRFVEVETDDGKSVRIGEWIERTYEFWILRITALPSPPEAEQ